LIRNCIRKTDIIGRYGGDEFLVILPETTPHNAGHAASRIQHMFMEKISRSQTISAFHLSLSIGVAGYPSKNVKDRKDFIILADHAMYDAKKSGRNRIVTV
jgi:diguanylate cyclase (GGDEF)-like protein